MNRNHIRTKNTSFPWVKVKLLCPHPFCKFLWPLSRVDLSPCRTTRNNAWSIVWFDKRQTADQALLSSMSDCLAALCYPPLLSWHLFASDDIPSLDISISIFYVTAHLLYQSEKKRQLHVVYWRVHNLQCTRMQWTRWQHIITSVRQISQTDWRCWLSFTQ